MKDEMYIFVDGSSRGNPGPSGCGLVARDGDGRRLFDLKEHIGEKRTNNEAELEAIILALENSIGKTKSINIYSDSKLAIKGSTGDWEIKSSNLKPLINKVNYLKKKFDNVNFRRINRNKNKEADSLAKAGSALKSRIDIDDIT